MTAAASPFYPILPDLLASYGEAPGLVVDLVYAASIPK
jgi:hypothetical protein